MNEGFLAALCGDVTEDFQRDLKGAGVARLLEAYAAERDDWRRFAHFAPGGYTRNLVFKDAVYELLVLCWDTGQESPIHNHMGQNCWMAVLEGHIEEVQYLRDPAAPDLPPTEKVARVFQRGQVAYISDDIALHLVRPANGSPGVSLHLYSRPYDVCRIYCPQTGLESTKPLYYDSILGERFETPVPAGTAATLHP